MGLTSTLAIEAAIELKVRSILAPFEPRSVVIVAAKQSAMPLDLPGLGLRLSDLTPSREGTVSIEDVAAVDVTVLTPRALPEDLKLTLTKALAPQSKFHFQFETLSSEVASYARNEFTPIAAGSAGPGFSIVGISGVALAVGVVAWWVLRRISVGAVDRLVQGISPALEASGQQAPQPTQRQSATVHSSAGGKLELEGFSVESLVAVLSDCYWCEEDEYGAWIWNEMSPEQRKQVLAKWAGGKMYASFVTGFPPHKESFHTHPYYVAPSDLSTVSMDGAAEWLQREASAWHLLSPLRQKHLKLELKKRVALADIKAPTAAISQPVASSKVRVVTQSMDITSLSAQDELQLWENPAFVPPALRNGIASLVWVAKLGDRDRQTLLAGYSARDLASVWLGPVPVLAIIENTLPEKKRTLVAKYRNMLTPSRDNQTMRDLVDKACAILAKPPESAAKAEPKAIAA